MKFKTKTTLPLIFVFILIIIIVAGIKFSYSYDQNYCYEDSNTSPIGTTYNKQGQVVHYLTHNPDALIHTPQCNFVDGLHSSLSLIGLPKK